MKKNIPIIKAIFLSVLVATALCTVGSLAGGNSSQTGNNGIIVSGSARSISGTTRPGARIRIYTQDYRPYGTSPGFCDSTKADDSGHFAFGSASEGYYNLIVSDDHRGETAFLAHLPIFNDSVFTDTIASLKRPGFVSGVATDSLSRTFALSYVFIVGTPFYAVTRNDGNFTLGPLPAGVYFIGIIGNFQVVNGNGGLAPLLVESTANSAITVVPDSISIWRP
jgi:hypothetical protein